MRVMIKLLLVLVASVMLCACGQKVGYRATGDKDLTFQVLRASPDATGNAQGSYLFRIVPSRAKFETLSSTQKDSLTLYMDSCFYMSVHGQRKRPIYLQSIPNGIKGTFEFMADFDLKRPGSPDTMEFVYEDKYINQKIYRVKAANK